MEGPIRRKEEKEVYILQDQGPSHKEGETVDLL